MTSIVTRRLVAATVAAACLAFSATASATPDSRTASEQTPLAGALAQERYYSSYGKPATLDAGASAVHAQERYYSSYGEPEPSTVAQSPAPPDRTPWLPIGLSVAVALAVIAASAAQVRALRTRRAGARVTS
jgi:hypothetical protein